MENVKQNNATEVEALVSQKENSMQQELKKVLEDNRKLMDENISLRNQNIQMKNALGMRERIGMLLDVMEQISKFPSVYQNMVKGEIMYLVSGYDHYGFFKKEKKEPEDTENEIKGEPDPVEPECETATAEPECPTPTEE